MWLLNGAVEHRSSQSSLASASWEWKRLCEPGGAGSGWEPCGPSRKRGMGQVARKRMQGGVGIAFLESRLWGSAPGCEWRQGACFKHVTCRTEGAHLSGNVLAMLDVGLLWVQIGNKTFFWLSNAPSMLLTGDTMFFIEVENLAHVTTTYFCKTLTAPCIRDPVSSNSPFFNHCWAPYLSKITPLEKGPSAINKQALSRDK